MKSKTRNIIKAVCGTVCAIGLVLLVSEPAQGTSDAEWAAIWVADFAVMALAGAGLSAVLDAEKREKQNTSLTK